MNATIDLTGLNRALGDLLRALPGNAAQVLKIETGQLAWDISEALGPKTKREPKPRVEKDVGVILNATDRPSNLSPTQQFSKYPAFTWLQAGPAWLLGINDQDDMRDASTAQVQNTFFDLRGIPYEKTYQELGMRGVEGFQHIRRLNRKLVTRQNFQAVVNQLMNRVGESRASFARTAAELAPQKRIPSWVKALILKVTRNGKSIFNPAGLANAEKPTVDFGSTAPGVESNPSMVAKIQRAINKRRAIMADKFEKLARGYVYNWNTGQVFRAPANLNN